MTRKLNIDNAFNKRMTRTTDYNSGFKKLGVQWLIEHSISHKYLCWLDGFVLRNPQLIKPTKRYKQE